MVKQDSSPFSSPRLRPSQIAVHRVWAFLTGVILIAQAVVILRLIASQRTLSKPCTCVYPTVHQDILEAIAIESVEQEDSSVRTTARRIIDATDRNPASKPNQFLKRFDDAVKRTAERIASPCAATGLMANSSEETQTPTRVASM